MKLNNKNRISKSVFICASTILSLWLESTCVYAAETGNPEANSSESNTLNTKSVVNNQSKTKDNENQVKSSLTENKSKDVEVPKNSQDVNDTTKVVVHYAGDGSKWVPYVWGKKPNGNGVQYKWNGKDDYGYYANITVDGNEQEMGVLIKGTNSWDKDGQGNDRLVQVDDSGKAEVWYKQGSDEKQKVIPTYNAANVNVHYHGDSSIHSLNYWTDKDNTKKTFSLADDENGDLTGNFKITDQSFNKIFVSADSAIDSEVREFTPLPGKDPTDIYLVKGDKVAYYTRSFALAQESLASASMDSSKQVSVETGKKLTANEAKVQLQVKENTIANVEAIDPDADGKSKQFKITLDKDLDILNDNQIGLHNNYKSIDIGNYVRSKEFDQKYFYNGNDLGANYAANKTIVKLWAPTAKSVKINLYDSLDNSSAPTKTYVMNRNDKGVWTVGLTGNYKKWAYDYTLTFGNGKTTQSNDPYSKAVTVNGERSVIDNYDAIKPDNFQRMPKFSNPTNAIIYETSIRDFTSDKNSGIKDKGKYLGMIESGVTSDGQITGLNYLKSLGITHVQILPMFDFASVDETKSIPDYNWGYDPKNYNVPEGSYSSDAANPETRIMEMKEMINGLHKAGIRVVMDVVYNHVFNSDQQALNKTVPGYYFQYDDEGHSTNGTGCGNDVASERLMARKYIVDSVKYWAKNYNIDGFRFNLMGILDVDTMNEIRSELNKIDPSILVYGEGWDMRKTNRDIGAGQYNADKVDQGVGFFSDDIRNAIKGVELGGLTPALVEGNGQEKNYQEDAKKFIDGFLGGQSYGKDSNHPYQAPQQTINYVACHDNRTLYDMLKAIMPNETEANIIKRDKLATSMVMLAQGIPFIHAGQESLGTKDGNDNSYNASVEVNEINWKRVKENSDLVDYFKKLVNLRKSQVAFRQNDYANIAKTIKVISPGTNGIFAFEYDSKDQKMYVAFNVNDKDTCFDTVDLSNGKKLLDSDGKVKLGKVTELMPLSTLVVVQNLDITSDDSDSIVNVDSNTQLDDEDNAGVITNKNIGEIKITLTHNAYIYEKDGRTTVKVNGKNALIKAGDAITVLDHGKHYELNGRAFYRIGNNSYIKVSNTTSYYILKRNSFVYDKHGKVIKRHGRHVLIRKGSRITLHSAKAIKINGKKFYTLKSGELIKARNVKNIVAK